MPKIILSYIFPCLLVIANFIVPEASAQIRQQYTGSNIILIGFETPEGIIDFQSEHLQVRYNKLTERLECRLPVNSLYPLHDSIPEDMAYEVLFGSKYPEMVFWIETPEAVQSEPSFTEEPVPTTVTIEFQGTPNQKKVPVVFASEEGYIILSTTFDMRMSHFRATVPAQYAPLLSGRLLIKIRNARWINNPE